MALPFFLSMANFFFVLDQDYLSSKLSGFLKLVFMDLIQWFIFVISLGICVATTQCFWIICGLSWCYEVFLVVIREPDKPGSTSRNLDQYMKRKGRIPDCAYSSSLVILDSFQLFPHVKNGVSSFLLIVAHRFGSFVLIFADALFRCQSFFFLSPPTDGFLAVAVLVVVIRVLEGVVFCILTGCTVACWISDSLH